MVRDSHAARTVVRWSERVMQLGQWSGGQRVMQLGQWSGGQRVMQLECDSDQSLCFLAAMTQRHLRL